jgi:hypothetical protein
MVVQPNTATARKQRAVFSGNERHLKEDIESAVIIGVIVMASAVRRADPESIEIAQFLHSEYGLRCQTLQFE